MFGTARFVFEFLPSGALVPSVELDSVPLLTDLRALQGDGSTTVKLVTVLLEFSLYAMVLAYLVTAADEIVDYRSFKVRRLRLPRCRRRSPTPPPHP